MNYLSEDEAQQLFETAKQAASNCYAPYSNFPVGCAVLANDGTIYKGANVENASYGVTICAERTALGHAVTTGNRDIKAIAVYAAVSSISPCGACRQYIIEFGKEIVIVFKHEGQITQRTIGELLPFEFSITHLRGE